jgi:LacI family transcriptional regulator
MDDRLAGREEACAAGGADSDPRLLAYGDFGEAGGHAAMHRLLESGAGPTAVFAFNDLTAVGALRAHGQRGLRVPEDVSVVGFDDIRVARLRPRR